MSGGRRESETNSWWTPGTAMQVLAFGALTLSSYWQFREADGTKIADLNKAIALLEYRVGQLEKVRQ